MKDNLVIIGGAIFFLVVMGLIVFGCVHGISLDTACKAKGGFPYSDSHGGGHLCLKADAVIE